MRIDFSALEIDGMWPASARPNAQSSIVDAKEIGTVGVEFFKKFEKRLGKEIDPMLISAVAGVFYV